MLVGYLRVSTDTERQVLDLQRDALIAPGVDKRRQPDRRLCLGKPANSVGKHRRIEASAIHTQVDPKGRLAFLICPLTVKFRPFR